MRRLLLLILISSLFANCKVNSVLESLTPCSEHELISFEHPELGMNVKIPKNWETDIDVVLGDTLSVFSIDSTEENKKFGLISFSFFQFSSNESATMNFEILQSLLLQDEEIELLSKGDLQVGSNQFKFLLLFETMDDFPTTNLLAFKQDGTEVIHCSNRLYGKKKKLKYFCHFGEILEEVGK